MQNSTLAIKKSIKTLVTPVTTKLYYENVPDTATYPYIVYTLPSSFADGANTETYILEFDIWDNTQSQTALETLVQNVINTIDKKVDTQGDIRLRYELDSRLVITDPDVRISRRKLTFSAKAIQRR